MKQMEMFTTAEMGNPTYSQPELFTPDEPDLKGTYDVQAMDIPALEAICETDDDRLLIHILGECKKYRAREIHFI